ncbi:hypothetical protein ANCCAN_19875 [Ancylostoma caninum]|uniref:Uncharacterized protein n=1 Tax=Ancylostoma caninum TaxID=29170 RepID=A0A368FU01_ANCCA|nr:hypothetical protein ANCCAN_19875 [Ancylostoma caninum]
MYSKIHINNGLLNLMKKKVGRRLLLPRSRVKCLRRWSGVYSPVKPMSDMMCIDINVLAFIGEASQLVKRAANNSSTVTASTETASTEMTSTVTATYRSGMVSVPTSPYL